MARESLEALACKQAVGDDQVGTVWQHLKSGDLYEIISTAIREENGALSFTYRKLAGDPRVEFNRVASEFSPDRFRCVRGSLNGYEL